MTIEKTKSSSIRAVPGHNRHRCWAGGDDEMVSVQLYSSSTKAKKFATLATQCLLNWIYRIFGALSHENPAKPDLPSHDTAQLVGLSVCLLLWGNNNPTQPQWRSFFATQQQHNMTMITHRTRRSQISIFQTHTHRLTGKLSRIPIHSSWLGYSLALSLSVSPVAATGRMTREPFPGNIHWTTPDKGATFIIPSLSLAMCITNCIIQSSIAFNQSGSLQRTMMTNWRRVVFAIITGQRRLHLGSHCPLG